jgi:hypothetical protein
VQAENITINQLPSTFSRGLSDFDEDLGISSRSYQEPLAVERSIMFLEDAPNSDGKDSRQKSVADANYTVLSEQNNNKHKRREIHTAEGEYTEG